MPQAKCQVCNHEFYVKPSHKKMGWGKYCSAKCRTKSQYIGENVKCHVCQKEIYRSPSQIKHSKSGKFFCNKQCQTKWRNNLFSREKHPNWSGGVGSYRNFLKRKSKKPACVACGIPDERVLSAHHIDHDRKNNRLSNLTWLCMNCHHLVHTDKKFEEYVFASLQV